jgi:hypothetical protein
MHVCLLPHALVAIKGKAACVVGYVKPLTAQRSVRCRTSESYRSERG